MIQEFIISGMTCRNCQMSVEKSLLSIKGITEVKIDLESGETKVNSKAQVSIAYLSKRLPKKFTITSKIEVNNEGQKSDMRKLFPLFLIITYISVTSFYLQKEWSANGFMLDFMGLFFIVFSFFKFLDLKGFVKSFVMYDPLAKKLDVYAWMYPFIETILGLMMLFRFETNIALISSVSVLMITTIGVLHSLINKRSIQCACLGTSLKLPMTKATLIENIMMLTMAFWMIRNIF